MSVTNINQLEIVSNDVLEFGIFGFASNQGKTGVLVYADSVQDKKL